MGNNRYEFDRYDSPHWFLTHLPNHLDLSGTVGEPCKGSGNLSDLLPYYPGVSKVWTNDIDPAVAADFNLDAVDGRSWDKLPPADWIVTNPPFNCPMPILKNAYKHARFGVVFFLRLSFIEPTKERAFWLLNHPRYLDLVYPRFKFRKDKKGRNWQTDSLPIAAFIWLKNSPRIIGSKTIPVELIQGFHDNPTNAPDFDTQIKILQGNK